MTQPVGVKLLKATWFDIDPKSIDQADPVWQKQGRQQDPIYVATLSQWRQTRSCWRHQMETFPALLAICAGNSPAPGEFPAQRPVSRSLDVFFDLRLSKCLSKQSWCWCFETPSSPLWRQCNVLILGEHLWKICSNEYIFLWCNMCLREDNLWKSAKN